MDELVYKKKNGKVNDLIPLYQKKKEILKKKYSDTKKKNNDYIFHTN